MTTETKTLGSLMQDALQKKAYQPASPREIASALASLDDALKIFHVSSGHPQHIRTSLQNAATVLSGLLYVITAGVLPVHDDSTKMLAKQITVLYGKINGYLCEYIEDDQFHCPLLPVKTLLKRLIAVNETLKQHEGIAELYPFLKPGLETIIATKTIHYHRWLWWCRFAAMYATSIHDLTSFRDLLVTLNFNTASFIKWLSGNVLQEIEAATTPADKLKRFSHTITKYEQSGSSAQGYLPVENSVSHALLTFLKRTFFCFTKIPVIEQRPFKTGLSKLPTALSVPQLALLIRLLAETKIINENNHSALLKTVAGIISTSKAADVSPESLRVNYYTPGHAAKSIVKEYLLNMMNLLRSY